MESKGLPFPDNFMAIFGFYRVPGSEKIVEIESVEDDTEEKEEETKDE